MTHVRGAFSNLLAPGFRKIVFESYKERPMEGVRLVNRNTSKRAYEEDFPIAGFGTLVKKPEGGSVTYQDALQGTIKRYTWSTYGLGYRITQEMMEDDLYGIMGGRMSRALGRSARNNQEILMHAPYNNAFNTAFSGFVAGESLCDTAHALLRGGTLANRPLADTDFDLLALQAAIEHFHSLTDESGIPAVYIPKLVVHSIGDHWLVNQILKSSQMPGSNQNDINQVAREGLEPHLSHYLLDPDAWFVLCSEHSVNYFDRRPFTFSNSDDFHTGDALFKGTRRAGSGFSDWRGVYGSPGV
jgi:hypothetical protein